MIHAAIVHDPILNEDVLSHVGGDEDGAVLLFLGVVRDHADGRPVTGMTYESYEEMATPVLREIAGEAAERIGSDRAESYEASRYVIEEIKKRLPIWKKEHYADGNHEWVKGTVPPVAEPASATEDAR